jgi:hypothetical protein
MPTDPGLRIGAILGESGHQPADNPRRIGGK